MSTERDDSKIETSMTPAEDQAWTRRQLGGAWYGGRARAHSAVTRRGVLKAGTAAGLAVTGVGGFLPAQPRAPVAIGANAMAPARQNDNVLVAGWEEDAQTLDPAKTICGHEVRIVNQFGNTLWGLEGTSTDPVPMLAESWEGS